jgi:hypothetical protein
MAIKKGAEILKDMIEKAIEDLKITETEYEIILHLANEDGFIDPHEKVLLNQLQVMINNKSVNLMQD